MAMIRQFGRIFLNFKHVELAIAEMVYFEKNEAFKRPIDAIEKKVIEETLQTVTDAVSSSILQSGLSADQKAETERICVTSMPHASDEDPLDHSTFYGLDKFGWAIWVAHTSSDPRKQQPARYTPRFDVISGS